MSVDSATISQVCLNNSQVLILVYYNTNLCDKIHSPCSLKIYIQKCMWNYYCMMLETWVCCNCNFSLCHSHSFIQKKKKHCGNTKRDLLHWKVCNLYYSHFMNSDCWSLTLTPYAANVNVCRYSKCNFAQKMDNRFCSPTLLLEVLYTSESILST